MVDYHTPSENIVKIIKSIDYLNNISNNFEKKMIIPKKLEKIDENIVVSPPTINNYNVLIKYNYNIPLELQYPLKIL